MLMPGLMFSWAIVMAPVMISYLVMVIQDNLMRNRQHGRAWIVGGFVIILVVVVSVRLLGFWNSLGL